MKKIILMLLAISTQIVARQVKLPTHHRFHKIRSKDVCTRKCQSLATSALPVIKSNWGRNKGCICSIPLQITLNYKLTKDEKKYKQGSDNSANVQINICKNLCHKQNSVYKYWAVAGRKECNCTSGDAGYAYTTGKHGFIKVSTDVAKEFNAKKLGKK